MDSALTAALLAAIGRLGGRLGQLEADNAYLREEVRALEARVLESGALLAPLESRAGLSAVSTVLTRSEMRRAERDNIIRALEACDWRVSGQRGAATLLGVKATTLASRIKALGISRRARTAATPAIPEF